MFEYLYKEEIRDLYAEVKRLEEKIERYEEALSSMSRKLREYMENYKLREANGWDDRFKDGIDCAYNIVITNWDTVDEEEDDDDDETEERGETNE